MIEKIEMNGSLLAQVFRDILGLSHDGIRFLTPDEFPLQCGVFNHNDSHIIQPHYHKDCERVISGTAEFLIVLKGTLRCSFADVESNLPRAKQVEINEGDSVLILRGVHGFKTIGETRLLEIKQGPYFNENDKVRINDSSL